MVKLSKYDTPFARLELSNFLRKIAASMIGVFVPLLMLKLGGSLQDILIFLGIQYCFYLFFLPLTVFLHKIIGIKHTMALGILVSIVSIFIINGISKETNFTGLGILLGLDMALYFLGFYYLFNQYSNVLATKENFQNNKSTDSIVKNVAIDQFLLKLVSSAIPVGVGVILVLFSKNVLIFGAIFLLVLSSGIFLIDRHDQHIKPEIKLGIFKNKDLIKMFGYFMILGIDFVIAGTIWPVILLIQSRNNLVKSGGIILIAFFISTIFIFGTGKLYQKFPVILKFGAILNGIHWILKAFFSGEFALIGLQTTHEISKNILNVSLGSKINLKAKSLKEKSSIYNYFLVHEIGLNVGKLLIICVFGFFSNPQALLLVTGILSFGLLLI